MLEVRIFYASGALECPLPRSPNTTTAIAIYSPIASPNAEAAASAIVDMLKLHDIYYCQFIVNPCI